MLPQNKVGPLGGISGPGAYERIRTSTGNVLNVVPLPLGYVRVSRPSRIRTDTLQDLNLPPLPLGYGSTLVPANRNWLGTYDCITYTLLSSQVTGASFVLTLSGFPPCLLITTLPGPFPGCQPH